MSYMSCRELAEKVQMYFLIRFLTSSTIAVDSHVLGVSNRLGLCKAKTPDATEFALGKKIR